MTNYLQKIARVGLLTMLLLTGWQPGWSQSVVLASTTGQPEPTGKRERTSSTEAVVKAPATAALTVAKPETVADPITGTVKSRTGEPLPGINVVIRNTQKGTSTDANGRFTIDQNK